MLFTRGLIGVLVVGALTSATLAKTHAPTLREQEEHACYHDATTLCGDFVPDEVKITACMKAKISQVSPGCLKYFKK